MNSKIFPKVINEINTKKCTFFVGAGISMLKPTYLPSGNELKNLSVKSICNNPSIKIFYKKLLSNQHFKCLIPEIMFQTLFEIVGTRLNTFFKTLDILNFNKVHQSLSWLNKHKGLTIFTTNFDLLIENSFKKNTGIIHLHGRLDKPDEMMMTISRISLGLPKHIEREFFEKTLNKNIYVLGYSGNDNDIISIFKRASFSNMFWMLKDINSKWTIENINRINKSNVYKFENELEKFFSSIIKKFNIPISLPKEIVDNQLDVLNDFSDSITIDERLAFLELLFFHLSKHETCIELCKIAERERKRFRKYKKSWFYMAASDNYRLLGKYDESIFYIRKAINSTKDLEIKSHSYNILGILFLEHIEYNPLKAIKHLLKAEGIVKKCMKTNSDKQKKQHLSQLLSKINNNMSMAFDDMGKFSDAIIYLKKCLKLDRKNGDVIGEAITYSNLSIIYYKIDEYGKYIYWQGKALELYKRYQLNYRLGYHYKEIGEIKCKNGKIKQGLEDLKQSLKYFEQDMSQNFDDIKKVKSMILNCKKATAG